MKVFLYLIRKEFLQLRRDKKMLPIVLIAPVLQLVLLGYAADLDVRHVPTALLDADHSTLSREVGERFFATDYFDRVATIGTPVEAARALLSGSASAVLVLPADFSRSLLRGEAADIQLIVDGSNSTTGTAVLNYANVIVQEYQRELMARGYRSSPALASEGGSPGPEQSGAAAARGAVDSSQLPIRVLPRVWYNPELESKNFMVPGILALLLMVITTLLSSLAIVKEKELGTLEQLNVTPITPMEIIVGKLIPFAIIGFVDVVLVVAVSRFLFRVPFEGSVALLLVMSLLFLSTTLGLGLLISTLSNNQQQAMMTSVFFVMVPMFFLSGFAFPIESMPAPIRGLTYLLPLRYYFVIVRGIFLKGATLSVLWDEALALLLFGIGILALAATRFKKRAG